MKSTFRFNGKELVVQDVIPADEKFNEELHRELVSTFGDRQFSLTPVENFTLPEQTESIFHGVISGKLESETPVLVEVFEGEELIMSMAGFISFRK